MAEGLREVKLLGTGSFGKCYLCENPANGNKFVVKQVDVSQMSPAEKKAAYHEAKIMSAFDHPNIIKFRNVYTTTNGKLNIVMDYADGGDLSHKIKNQRGHPLPEKDIIDLFVQICLAIKHVHDKKILHRDIKTQNVFLMQNGMVKLGDFGIARVLSNSIDKAKTMVGTPYYLSPEIIENRPYSFKSDVWALGVLLYELCALRPPFDGTSLQNLAIRIVRGNYSPVPPQYSPDLKNLVAQMLSVDQNRRPTLAQILRNPLIKGRIERVLSESISHRNYSTIKPPEDIPNQRPPNRGGRRPEAEQVREMPVKEMPVVTEMPKPAVKEMPPPPKIEQRKPNLYVPPEISNPVQRDYGPRVPPVKKQSPPPAEFRGGLEDVFKPVSRDPPRSPPKRQPVQKPKPVKPSIDAARKEEQDKLRQEKAKKRDEEHELMKEAIRKKREEMKRVSPESPRRFDLREEMNKRRAQKKDLLNEMPNIGQIEQKLERIIRPKETPEVPPPVKKPEKQTREEPKKPWEEALQNIGQVEQKLEKIIRPKETPAPNKVEKKTSEEFKKSPEAPRPEKKTNEDAKKPWEEARKKMREDINRKRANNKLNPEIHVEWIGGIATFGNDTGEIVLDKDQERLYHELQQAIEEPSPQEPVEDSPAFSDASTHQPEDSEESQEVSRQDSIDEEIIDQEDELEGKIVLPMDSIGQETSKFSAIELFRDFLEKQLGLDTLFQVYNVIKQLDSEGKSVVYEEVLALLDGVHVSQESIKWVHSLVYFEKTADPNSLA